MESLLLQPQTCEEHKRCAHYTIPLPFLSFHFLPFAKLRRNSRGIMQLNVRINMITVLVAITSQYNFFRKFTKRMFYSDAYFLAILMLDTANRSIHESITWIHERIHDCKYRMYQFNKNPTISRSVFEFRKGFLDKTSWYVR